MKCVVLAAGYGTRLLPFTSHRPKQMLPVGGKPILLHGLEYIRDVLEIKEIIMVVGYQRDKIMDYFGDGHKFNLNITYVIQHLASKKGLAAGLQLVEDFIDTDFCLYLADNIFNADLRKVLEFHKTNTPGVTLHVEEHDNPSRFGVVTMDEENKVLNVIEKPKNPKSNLVITGFYVFSPAIFKFINKLPLSERGEYELTDAIQNMIDSNYNVYALKINGWRQDIGYAEDILTANEILMNELGSKIESNLNNCNIIEPVSIGKNCKLTNSKIGPFVTIGDNTILENSKVLHSVILNNSKIKNSVIKDSVIGSKCRIENMNEYSVKIGDYSQISRISDDANISYENEVYDKIRNQ